MERQRIAILDMWSNGEPHTSPKKQRKLFQRGEEEVRRVIINTELFLLGSGIHVLHRTPSSGLLNSFYVRFLFINFYNIHASPFVTTAKSPSWDQEHGFSLTSMLAHSGSSLFLHVLICEINLLPYISEWSAGSSKELFLKVMYSCQLLLLPLPCVPGVGYSFLKYFLFFIHYVNFRCTLQRLDIYIT